MCAIKSRWSLFGDGRKLSGLKVIINEPKRVKKLCEKSTRDVAK